MKLFTISRHGLAVICILVVALWGLIAAERRVQNRIDREYQELRQDSQSAQPAIDVSRPASEPAATLAA